MKYYQDEKYLFKYASDEQMAKYLPYRFKAKESPNVRDVIAIRDLVRNMESPTKKWVGDHSFYIVEEIEMLRELMEKK